MFTCLLSSSDIVYVGSIHPTHFEISSLMINAGKHVLCEKPMTMNLRQTTELIQLAKEKKVFLMEVRATSQQTFCGVPAVGPALASIGTAAGTPQNVCWV